MAEETNDQAQAGVESTGAEQVEQTQAAQGTDQAQSGAVSGSEIKVGNQSFKTQADLAKAYEELQKGFTQKTQKYSEELKAYKGLQEWVSRLSTDERQRFMQYVKGGASPQQAANAVQQSQQTQQPSRYDAEIQRLDEANRMSQHKLESFEFKQAHPDLTMENLTKVADVVDEFEARGMSIPLEAAYRLAFFDDRIASAASEGQKKAEAAITKGRNAGALTPTAGSAQGAKQVAKKFSPNASLTDNNARIRELMRENGVTFDKP